jgi:hypothetical protein
MSVVRPPNLPTQSREENLSMQILDERAAIGVVRQRIMKTKYNRGNAILAATRCVPGVPTHLPIGVAREQIP